MVCVPFRFALTMHFDLRRVPLAGVQCVGPSLGHASTELCAWGVGGEMLSSAWCSSRWQAVPLKWLVLHSVRCLLVLWSCLSMFLQMPPGLSAWAEQQERRGQPRTLLSHCTTADAVSTPRVGRSQLKLGFKPEFLKTHWEFYIGGRPPLHSLKSSPTMCFHYGSWTTEV